MSRPDEIRAGDVVVCVDARSPNANGLPSDNLIEGRHYRVASTYPTNFFTGLGLVLRETRPRVGARGFHAFRFRKLDAAEDCFTQAMRNLIPLETEVT